MSILFATHPAILDTSTGTNIKLFKRVNTILKQGISKSACASATGIKYKIRAMKPASVAQLDAPSDWRPGGRGFNPCRGRQHSVIEIDHEIFSTVILSLPLIQEGQLSVSGERMPSGLGVDSVTDRLMMLSTKIHPKSFLSSGEEIF